HQRCHDARVALDDVLRRVDAELAPGDLLVGYGPGVRAVAGSRIGDLAEVGPHGDVLALQVRVQHRDHADGEVAGDAAADLEKANPVATTVRRVPVGQCHHVFDAGAHGVDVLDVAGDAVARVHVAQGRVFPARHPDRKVLLARSEHP